MLSDMGPDFEPVYSCRRQGELAYRHIVIADQSMVRPCKATIESLYPYSSQDGVFDERCVELARLCRTSVDYATNGITVEIDNQIPKPFIKSRPDWLCPEVPGLRPVDYYQSGRALGHLFRNIDMHDLPDGIQIISQDEIRPLEDAISRALTPLIQSALCTAVGAIDTEDIRVEDIHRRYASEMRFICVTHSIENSPDTRLSEEEVVLGTILAKCSQPRWRAERAERMRGHAEALVCDIRAHIVKLHPPLSEEGLRGGLRDAWAAWNWAQHHREEPFILSFSLVVLGLILELLGLSGVLVDF
jgi:RNA-dependent RNA polymerase